ncbi:serine/threonine-protein kinase [Candidatus Frankia nodulisporulans]|uniref:serine/threonine-protein kinase n=1 Tax=Candidatus Frankia nodulisporulans TaxID=2060052 RepID=UPI0013D4E4B1|nr:serine/threonine-protein kinase [Candidatus Frankia nodulisporulans]
MNNSPGNSSSPSQPFAGAASPNTVLDNRYRLDGRIAAGGMGEVWRGLDQTLGRPVAVKLLRPEYASDESFLVRFRGEARHAARLSHPGVASVYDYGEVATADDYPTAYLVMELVEGEPLSAMLHREKRLSAERMLDILGQAADALQAAHALGVVHRDVKPGNLLLRPDGVVKVTDFGIARAVDAAPLTATGIMMGTAYYVSPEQASGRPVTPASDVYSLGVVAYECLAGRRPFDDRNPIVVVMAHQQDTPAPLPTDIPYQVRALVDSAMAKDPSRRPSSAGAFARSAAGIRRNLWPPENGRWPSGPSSPDLTARHPSGPGLPPPAAGRAHRQTSRSRPPSWLPQEPDAAAGRGGSGPGRGGSGPDRTQVSPDRTQLQPDGDLPATAMHSPPTHGPDTGYNPGSGYGGPNSGYGQDPGYGPDARGRYGEGSRSGGEPSGYGSSTGYGGPGGGYPGTGGPGYGDGGGGGYGDTQDPGTIYKQGPSGWSDPAHGRGGESDWSGGRAERRRGASAGAGRWALPLPLLIILLVLTVAITAFVSNRLFTGNGSESNSAATPAGAVSAPPVVADLVGEAGESS